MVFKKENSLKRELGLIDVIAISTGAMISAGFFLLPGIAAMQTGSSVFLAYFLGALLMLPAMFSMAEMATATPKAGGAYFFIDRSLGPLFGTIGGVGNYLALVMKTSFALVGMGAYAALFFDIPIRLTAIMFGLVFMLMNIFGVKKTSGLQRVLVLILLIILMFFVAEGLREVFFSAGTGEYLRNFTPFLTNGFEGLMATTGLVFVSYLGLTQIASMSEEIKKPERNIPVGMILSLIITAIIYVFGVIVMVGVIPPDQLFNDNAPASTAAQHIFSLLPPQTGTLLIIFAAVTAFASTGNAGMMTASRFPLAMSRDKLLPGVFSKISMFNTPAWSILFTGLILIVVVASLSESDIAKMASSFQLMIFILLNASVIVMRKSRIEAYDPGYRTPFFPWMQIAGIICYFFLIIYMGWGPGLFIMGVIIMAIAWYWYYARKNTKREGAIFHWFALLGKMEHKELENEFLHILKEKGLRDGDPFDEMIVQANITYLGRKRISFRSLVKLVSHELSLKNEQVDKDEIKKEFMAGTGIDPALIIPQVSILYGKSASIEKPILQVVISDRGVKKPIIRGETDTEQNTKVFLFMLNRIDRPKQRLRFLSRLMDIIERDRFVEDITAIKNPREIKEYLLHNDRYITLHLQKDSPQKEFINKTLKEVKLPADVLVAMIQRNNQTLTPRGDTTLQENDIITIIGEPKGIKILFNKYIHNQPAE
jgi:basic amino acid/polyamine antiporter, APA family